MKDINRVLSGMNKYAEQNNDSCELIVTKPKELNRIYVMFEEGGLVMELHINTWKSKVLIIEFSEDSTLNGTVMSEKEFCKWQSAFLNDDTPKEFMVAKK